MHPTPEDQAAAAVEKLQADGWTVSMGSTGAGVHCTASKDGRTVQSDPKATRLDAILQAAERAGAASTDTTAPRPSKKN